MTHKERVEKIKNFTSNNRIFTVATIFAIVLLLGNIFLNNKPDIPKENTDSSSISESSDTNVTSDNDEKKPKKNEEEVHWRFYWIDLWILGIGGGFCTIKILQEKRKAREKLK